MGKEKIKTILGLFLGAIGIILVQYQLRSVEGLWGHDTYPHVARLVMGAVHAWQNGAVLPHYLPSLCGGLPFLSDPQNLYFSLPGWLVRYFDPILAIQISSWVHSLLGFWGMLKLAQYFRIQGLRAQVCALFFVLNGFSFAHSLVGHLTHQSFFLLPWGLLWWFQLRVIPLSLLGTYLLLSGSVHMAVVLGGMGILSLPFWLSHQKRSRPLKEIIGSVFLIFILFGFCTAGKIVGVYLYSKNFFTLPNYAYSEPSFWVWFRYLWFFPPFTPSSVVSGMWSLGAWEYIGFISKFTWLGLALFLISLLKKGDIKKLWIVSWTMVAVIFVIAIAPGGFIHQHLPWVKHYHNPIKLLAVFVPLLILAQGRGWEKAWGNKKDGILILFAILALGEFYYYSEFFRKLPNAFNFKYEPSIYAALKEQKKLTPIKEITSQRNKDLEGILEGSTSLSCYEPIFGYLGEARHFKIKPGPVLLKADTYNINHPGCFLYPEYFHCQAWDATRVDEEVSFNRFVRGEAPNFPVPYWHRILWWMNFLFIVGGLTGWIANRS